MTIWNPELAEGRQKYVAIADALERDIAEGRLSDGQQLPTHRELADVLGVTVGTITRAYAEAERRGLTIGEVGRGTFVRARREDVHMHRWGIGGVASPATVDMRHSLAPDLPDLEGRAMECALRSIPGATASELVRLPGNSALLRHREAGAEWMRRVGASARGEDVLLTAGVQHGITVCLMALLEPRDVLLAGEFTYPGLRSLASMLGIRLRPVALDEEGIMPEALERACRTEPRPRALYVVPTIQNPTGGTLSLSRRKEIAKIAEKHDLVVIEDQVHGLLPVDPPAPITSIIPDLSVCLASPSKSIAPGLRVGFVVAPPDTRHRLLTAINSTLWTVPPLVSEIFSFWLDSGLADEILIAKREETAVRQNIVDEYFSDRDVRRDRLANHFWLRLPDSWSEQGFIRSAADAGVLIPGSETFAVGRNDSFQGARVSIGTMSHGELRRGLRTLCELLDSQETPALTVI